MSVAQDPMRPPNWSAEIREETATKLEPLELQQILNSNNRKVAVINGIIVVEGQVIAGAKVIKISEKFVRIMHRGRQVNLTMADTIKEYSREK